MFWLYSNTACHLHRQGDRFHQKAPQSRKIKLYPTTEKFRTPWNHRNPKAGELNCQGDMELSGSGGRKSSQNKREVTNVVLKRWQKLSAFAMQSLHVHLWKWSTTESIYYPLNLHFFDHLLILSTQRMDAELSCKNNPWFFEKWTDSQMKNSRIILMRQKGAQWLEQICKTGWW